MLGALPGAPCFDGLASSPVLPNDILQQAVPGNLRRADQFVRFLRRLVAHLLKRMVRPTGLHPPHPPTPHTHRLAGGAPGRSCSAPHTCEPRPAVDSRSSE